MPGWELVRNRKGKCASLMPAETHAETQAEIQAETQAA